MFIEEFMLDAAGVFQDRPGAAAGEGAHMRPGLLLGPGPSVLLASDLFGAFCARRREVAQGASLNLLAQGVGARAYGERLDQFDLDVFLYVILAAVRGANPVIRPLRDVLRAVGQKPVSGLAARLEASLRRLASTRLEVSGADQCCLVQLAESVLVDVRTGMMRVRPGQEAVEAFAQVTGLERLVTLRRDLGRRQLTKWIAGLLSVLTADVCLLDPARLRVLSGLSAQDPEIFFARVQAALSTLVDMGYVRGVNRHYDCFIVFRHGGRSRAQECHLVR